MEQLIGLTQIFQPAIALLDFDRDTGRINFPLQGRGAFEFAACPELDSGKSEREPAVVTARLECIKSPHNVCSRSRPCLSLPLLMALVKPIFSGASRCRQIPSCPAGPEKGRWWPKPLLSLPQNDRQAHPVLSPCHYRKTGMPLSSRPSPDTQTAMAGLVRTPCGPRFAAAGEPIVKSGSVLPLSSLSSHWSPSRSDPEMLINDAPAIRRHEQNHRRFNGIKRILRNGGLCKLKASPEAYFHRGTSLGATTTT